MQREDEGKKELRVTNNQTLMEVEESVGNARINEKNVLYDTTKYERIIYWSKEDECWVAEVPELAGGSADGKTALEALCNSEQIIMEWIETAKVLGREIPIPAGTKV